MVTATEEYPLAALGGAARSFVLPRDAFEAKLAATSGSAHRP